MELMVEGRRVVIKGDAGLSKVMVSLKTMARGGKRISSGATNFRGDQRGRRGHPSFNTIWHTTVQ